MVSDNAGDIIQFSLYMASCAIHDLNMAFDFRKVYVIPHVPLTNILCGSFSNKIYYSEESLYYFE